MEKAEREAEQLSAVAAAAVSSEAEGRGRKQSSEQSALAERWEHIWQDYSRSGDKRTHQGNHCNGRTPLQTLTEGLNIVIEKVVNI